jgi:hypothetical protein
MSMEHVEVMISRDKLTDLLEVPLNCYFIHQETHMKLLGSEH